MTFSVVIPVFNGELFLEETILSVINQSRKADEILIYDDGSFDSSKTIVDKYQDRVKYILNPNGPSGFVNGWNNAIKHSNSDFITLLHQDDLLHKDFILEAEKNLKLNPEIKHLFAICEYVNEFGEVNDNLSYSDCLISQKDSFMIFKGIEYFTAYQKKYGNTLHIHRCPGVITHRSIFFNDNCWYNPNAGHIADDDFFYRVSFLTDVIGMFKPLAYYRIHNNSETNSIGDLNLVQRLSNDYLFQINQWRKNNLLNKEQIKYFNDHFLKYNRRLLSYSIKYLDLKSFKLSFLNYINFKNKFWY